MQLHQSFIGKTLKLWAFFILPLINLSALFLCDPINENITHIAYANNHLPFVILWAGSCAYYFWYTGTILIQKLNAHKKSCYWLLTASCLLMIISILIPYDNQINLLSKLHVRSAMIATISYIILILYILCQLYIGCFAIKTMLCTYISFIALLCLLFLLTGCISAVIEVSFVIFMGIFLYLLLQKQT